MFRIIGGVVIYAFALYGFVDVMRRIRLKEAKTQPIANA